ncbi:ferrous iron transport protein A [Peptococcaceae bacterium]|nr:ferrous iron transport protein A [Peptococcaceae bacterium]
MGIEDGKEVKIITKQPFGPVIVETGNVQTAIGRGMSGKIYMKVYKI